MLFAAGYSSNLSKRWEFVRTMEKGCFVSSLSAGMPRNRMDGSWELHMNKRMPKWMMADFGWPSSAEASRIAPAE
jgi:hypothetical protein